MSKMRYKEGDRVRVRQWEAMARQYALLHNNDIGIYKELHRELYLYRFPIMYRKFCGQVVTIKEVENGYYRIKEDDGQWRWIDEEFEGHAFEYGELIEVSHSDNEWERRIYVGYIDGTCCPYVCVCVTDEDKFREGKNYNYGTWAFARPIPKKHTIIIDGVEIKVSDEDYKALKEKLCGEK